MAILVITRDDFCTCYKKLIFIIIDNTMNKSPSQRHNKSVSVKCKCNIGLNFVTICKADLRQGIY